MSSLPTTIDHHPKAPTGLGGDVGGAKEDKAAASEPKTFSIKEISGAGAETDIPTRIVRTISTIDDLVLEQVTELEPRHLRSEHPTPRRKAPRCATLEPRPTPAPDTWCHCTQRLRLALEPPNNNKMWGAKSCRVVPSHHHHHHHHHTIRPSAPSRRTAARCTRRPWWTWGLERPRRRYVLEKLSSYPKPPKPPSRTSTLLCLPLAIFLSATVCAAICNACVSQLPCQPRPPSQGRCRGGRRRRGVPDPPAAQLDLDHLHGLDDDDA